MTETSIITELRELFPVTRKWNYLYNGGIHSCPKPVGDTMRNFITNWEEGGRDAWPPAYEKFIRLKEKFAALVGAESRNIVITDSTSSAINMAARMLSPQPGQNVVVSDLTYMSDSYAWLASHPEIEVRFVNSRDGLVFPEDIITMVDKNTLAVNLCAVTAGTGFRFDLEKVYASLPTPKNPLLIDASQSLGVIKMNVGKPPVDFLASTAGKWLMGPSGVGFLYVSDKFMDSTPPAAGWLCAANNRDWNVRECVLHEDASRFQGGIPNLVGAVGALAALELIEQIGIDFIQERVSRLIGYAMEKLGDLDVDLRTPRNPDQRAGLIFFKLPGAKELYLELQSAQIYCGCFMEGIRIDPNFYNTFEEIDQFISVVKNFISAGNN
jgi:cysteine desulfurase / selenocysteine lyase